MITSKFLQTLEALMTQKSVTLADLARETGIKYHRAAQWKRSNVDSPNGADLEALALYFKVSTSFLLSGKTDPSKDDRKSILLSRISASGEDTMRQLEEYLDFLESRQND